MRAEVRRIWRVHAALLVVVAAFLGWSFLIEPNRLVVHRVSVSLTMPMPTPMPTPMPMPMPASAPLAEPSIEEGLTIAVLGDLHAGAPFIDRAKIRTIVETTNALRPDLVVLLGDTVIQDVLFGTFLPPETVALELARLHAPRGVFAVLGNHDWWLDGSRVRKALEGANLRVLENESIRLGPRLWIGGLADLWTRKADIGATLKGVPEGDAMILLTHSPDVFPSVPSRVSLTLAAHTHGGQVSLPLFGRLIVPSRYGERFAAGLIEENGRKLFVTTGIGTSIIPIRFRVPPEIAFLNVRIRRAASPGTRRDGSPTPSSSRPAVSTRR